MIDVADVPKAYLQINNKKYFLYENEHNTIGRNLKARVNIKSLNVSQLHSCITIIGSKHFVSDFNSTNNTFLNQTKLVPFKLYEIISDDEIKFGDIISTYKHLNPNESNEILQFGESQSMSQTFYKTNTQNIMENTQLHNIINQATTQLLDNDNNMTTQEFTAMSINDASTQKISIGINEAVTQVIPTCFNEAVTQKICTDNIDDSGRETPDDLNEEEISIFQNDEVANSAKDDVHEDFDQQRVIILNNKSDIPDESNDSFNFITDTNINDEETQKIFTHNLNETSRDTSDHLHEVEMPILQDDEGVNSRNNDSPEELAQQKEIMLNNKPVFADINENPLNEEKIPILENDEVNSNKDNAHTDFDEKEIILNNKLDTANEGSSDLLELMSESSILNKMNKPGISNSTPRKILIKASPEIDESGNYSTDVDTDIEDNVDTQTVNESNIIPETQLAYQSIVTEKENNETRIEIVPENLAAQSEKSSASINSLQLSNESAKDTNEKVIVESVPPLEERNEDCIIEKGVEAETIAENDSEEKQQESIESATLKETDTNRNTENDETLSDQEAKLNKSDTINSEHDYYILPTQEMPQSSSKCEHKFSFKKPNSVLKMNASMEKLISDDEELYNQSTQKMSEDSSEKPTEDSIATMEEVIVDGKELYQESTQKMNEKPSEELKENPQSVEINNIDCPTIQKLSNGETNDEDDLFYLPPTQALEKLYNNIEDNSTAQIQSSGSSVEEQFEMMFATQSESREEAFPATQQLVTILEDKGDEPVLNYSLNSVNESVDIIDNSVSEMSMALSRQVKSISHAKVEEEEIPATQELQTLLESREINVSLNKIENKAEVESANLPVTSTSAMVTRKRKSVDDVVVKNASSKRKKNQTVIEETGQAVAGNSKADSRQSTFLNNTAAKTRQTRSKKKIESSDSEEELVASNLTDASKPSLQRTLSKTATNKTILSEETSTATRSRKGRLIKKTESSDSEEELVASNLTDASKPSLQQTLSKTATNKTILSEETSTATKSRKGRLIKKIQSSDSEEIQTKEIEQKNIIPERLTRNTSVGSIQSGQSTILKTSTTARSRKTRSKRKIESSDSEEEATKEVEQKNNSNSTVSKTLRNKTLLFEETSTATTSRTIRSKMKTETDYLENTQNAEQIQQKRTTKKSSSVLPMTIDLKVPKKKVTRKPSPEPKPEKVSRKISVNNIEMPLTPSRSRRQLKPKVVFSMMDNPELESAVRQLGGLIVDTVEASTVLVTENVKRSQKLLCAVGQGKPICNPQWIHESKKQYNFLDPWDFIIVDNEAEKKWNFTLKESILRGGREKLLEDYTFQVMVNTGGDCLRGAIEACGGKCVTRNLGKATTSHIMIVATPDNRSKFSKILKQDRRIKVVLPEAIFEGALRQEYNFDEYVVV